MRRHRRRIEQRRRRPLDAPAGWQTGPPDFIGIGAQKAGTSWWFAMLRTHPQIRHARGRHPKELQFFDRYFDRSLTSKDVAEYHTHFAHPPDTLAGEWTPHYLAQFWTLPMLRQAAPDAKLLVMLRDPVERYRSGMAHSLNRIGRLTPTIAAHHFHNGLYGQQLARLMRLVPRNQVLIQQYERCRIDPQSELRRTFQFLGLDPIDVPHERIVRKVNASTRRVVLEPSTRDVLAAAYTEDAALLTSVAPEIDPSLWPSLESASRR